MINLRTGTPGACKTLSAVEALAKMQARWGKNPEEARPIFVHGVKDLALPHAPVPVKEWREGGAKPPVMVPDWDAMPDGSWVLIDEAQSFFPPRSSAATPPPHVAWLNTHRHRGFDIEVITQHPKLIDGSLRALVGKHQHFRRLFGGQRSYCYEWDACSDSLSGLNNAVGGYYPFPKKAFQWYKSAEVHTKQKFKLPKWLLIPVIGIVIGLVAIPRAYSVLTGGIMGKGLSAKVASATASAPAASAAVAAVSAPAQSSLVHAVAEAIKPTPVAGCMATPTKCLCVDQAGLAAHVDEDVCRAAAVTLGGLVPYDTTPRPRVSTGDFQSVPALVTSQLEPMHIPTAPSVLAPRAPLSTHSLVMGQR